MNFCQSKIIYVRILVNIKFDSSSLCFIILLVQTSISQARTENNREDGSQWNYKKYNISLWLNNYNINYDITSRVIVHITWYNNLVIFQLSVYVHSCRMVLFVM